MIRVRESDKGLWDNWNAWLNIELDTEESESCCFQGIVCFKYETSAISMFVDGFFSRKEFKTKIGKDIKTQ